MGRTLSHRWLILGVLLGTSLFVVTRYGSRFLQGSVTRPTYVYFTPQESAAGIDIAKGKFAVMSCAGKGSFPVLGNALRSQSGSLSFTVYQYPRRKGAAGTYLISEARLRVDPALRATNTLTQIDRGVRYHVYSADRDLTFACGTGLDLPPVCGNGKSGPCVAGYCSDGILDPDGKDDAPNTVDDEQCDDGNIFNNDGCTVQCREEISKLSTRIVGPETWSNARSLCQQYAEDGLTNWSLPLRDQLVFLRQRLLDLNIRSELWASNKPGGQNSFTYNPVTNTWSSRHENSLLEAVCVNPTMTYRACGDSDNTQIGQWQTEQSKYTAGMTRITNGTTIEDNADTCVTPSSVREYYCLGTELRSYEDYCPNGYGCVNGACRRSLPAGQQPYPKPQCMDLIDNDRDGVHDNQTGVTNGLGFPLGDPGCMSRVDEDESDGTTACQDGTDNDGDGKTDLDDLHCVHPTETTEDFYRCTESDNGITPGTAGTLLFVNDATGAEQYRMSDECYSKTTFTVGDCSGSACVVREGFCSLKGRPASVNIACSNGCVSGVCASPDPKPQCSDGLDNDGDKGVDYFGIGNDASRDRGCDSETDNDESDRPDACQDGADNDGDGKTDLTDPGCVSILDNNEGNVYPAPVTLRSVTVNTCQGVKSLIVDYGINSDNCAYLQDHWNGDWLAPLFVPHLPDVIPCFWDPAAVVTLPAEAVSSSIVPGHQVALFGQLEPKLHSDFVTVGQSAVCP